MVAAVGSPSGNAETGPATCPKWAVSPSGVRGWQTGAPDAAIRGHPNPSDRDAGSRCRRPQRSATVCRGPVPPSPARTGHQACAGPFLWEARLHPQCGRRTSHPSGRYPDPFAPRYATQYAFVPERPVSASWSGRPRIPARNLTGALSRTERSDTEPLRNCARTRQGPAARACVSGPDRAGLRRYRSRCTLFCRDAVSRKTGRHPFTGRRPWAGQKSNSSPRKLSRRFFL